MRRGIPFRRAVRCLAIAIVIVAGSGCAMGDVSTWNWFNTSRHRSAPSRRPAHRPNMLESKPTDAGDDSDDRHPSRWKRKLRVKYAAARSSDLFFAVNHAMAQSEPRPAIER